MADETTEQDEITTDADAPDAEAEGEGEGRKVKRSTPDVGVHSLLTRESDQATRPGFRNPANSKSKAQKKRKGKKGRRK